MLYPAVAIASARAQGASQIATFLSGRQLGSTQFPPSHTQSNLQTAAEINDMTLDAVPLSRPSVQEEHAAQACAHTLMCWGRVLALRCGAR